MRCTRYCQIEAFIISAADRAGVYCICLHLYCTISVWKHSIVTYCILIVSCYALGVVPFTCTISYETLTTSFEAVITL